MSETAMGNELRAAVHELQRYLGDELAPMMVSDSMLLLMEQSPALLAPQIHAWVGSQYSRGGSNYTASDYLYHAVKKLHVLCELDLIGAERLRDYLKQLGEILIEDCPDEERERLRQQFGRLGESIAAMTTTQVDKIYQAGGGPQAGTAPVPSARKGS
ncbi:MAG TPA: hypothetical protein VE404_04245, partial [Verrucomicrobiae bacterium]|nr:hypothetical protein [Verrucomicrobiae bacterium]